MEIQAFLLGSILILLGMFLQNIYLSKRLYSVTQINRSYHHIFNQSYHNLFIIKSNGTLLEVNQNALNYYDLREDIRGKALWEVFSPIITSSTQQNLQDAIAQAAQGDLVSQNIELLQKKDTAICNFSFIPVTDKKRKENQIVVQVYNNNQANQTDSTLKQELLKTFFKNASIGLAILDDKWRHVKINQVLADINGKSVEEHIGKAVREMIPAIAPKLESIYQQVTNTGKPICEIEITGETPKEPGLIRNWEACYFSLPVSDNRNGIGCVVLEVTKRKKAEKALETRLQQQATVAQLGQLALSGLELLTLFDKTTALVAQSLNVDSCKILERLPENNNLLLLSGVGLEEGLVDKAIVETDLKSQAGYTLLSRQPVISENLKEETRFTDSSLLNQYQYISGISTIIPGQGNQPFGVLEAHSAITTQNKRRRCTATSLH